jgi:hypothetical protein
MDRRSFFARLLVAPAAMTSGPCPKPSPRIPDTSRAIIFRPRRPEEILLNWSGWRKGQSENSRIAAWWTAHLPKGMVAGNRYKHFVSIVRSSHAEYHGIVPCGYRPGENFDIANCIMLEESYEALETLGRGEDLQDICDRVFAKEKQRALDDLRKYLSELEITKA